MSPTIPCDLRRRAICVPELVYDHELTRGFARNFDNRRRDFRRDLRCPAEPAEE